jgi:hypothetical protein
MAPVRIAIRAWPMLTSSAEKTVIRSSNAAHQVGDGTSSTLVTQQNFPAALQCATAALPSSATQ